MISVLPPALFPPQALERAGQVDLAVRLWDSFFHERWLGGPARDLLEERLALAVDGGRWERAAELLQALVDSWPLASLVVVARVGWGETRDPAALAVLARVADVVCLAQDWRTVPAGPWCSPDVGWVRQQVGAEIVSSVLRRSVADGSDELAQALGVPALGEPPRPEGLATFRASELAEHRAALARSLAQGRLRAVLVEGDIPGDAATQLTLGELRLEGSHQLAVERFGLAGLALPAELSTGPWDGELHRAAPGASGSVLRPMAHGRYLPGPVGSLAVGRPQRVGYLLWAGSHAPLAVAPVAVAVLGALDGARDSAAVADLLGGPPDQVREVMDQLVTLGAATAIST